MQETARRTFVATLVALAVVLFALALWKLRLVLVLLFFAFVLAAAMRPGIEALRRRGVSRGFGVAIHYLALLGLISLFLSFVVPRALNQVQTAVGSVPTTSAQLRHAASHSTGIKHELLVSLQKRLKKLPTGSLVHPALTVTVKAFEVLVGIFFTFACAAYWIFERDRAVDLVTSLIARPKRKKVRDTWDLIDAKLGSFVRGQLLLVAFVAIVLSTMFALIGEPYWLLIGGFAGVVEMVPVIGPLAAGALAIGAGFTVSWHVALFAGIAVLAVRMIEDYLVVPRVLGHATGLSPLVVLVSVSAVGILFGGLAVLLAIPIAAVIVTLIDVIVRGKEPAEEEVPPVLFPAKEGEG